MSLTDVIQLLFEVYLTVLLLRLLLQWFGANYYNQVSQFVVKVTSPVVLPLRQVLPKTQHIDLALVLVILLFQMLKFAILIFLQAGLLANFAGLFVVSVADSINGLINVFLFSLLAMIIISWLNPQLRSPVTEILYCLTEPLLGRARRVIPNFGGIDLSPIPVMIGLKLFAFYMIKPVMDLGIMLSVRGLGG